ncbi:MAG: methyltransferase [Candidatus Bathyarchaeia archaeon]
MMVLKADAGWFFRRILEFMLAAINIAPSITVIINPLFFIMFLPVGAYAILAWPWSLLKDIPDPFHPGESLYWLTYAIKIDEENVFLPSLFRWGVVDLSLLAAGLVFFLAAFIFWLINLSRGGGLITSGVYGVVRHPQYLGIILLTLGVTIRTLRPASLIAWITLLTVYLILASLEEKNLLKIYGEKYVEYSKRTAFIIPYLKPNLPSWLSPEKPYRYMLLAVIWAALVVTVMVYMRDRVFALRSISPHGLGLI